MSSKLVAGSSNPSLAAAIALQLGFPLVPCDIKTFADGELNVRLKESVRGCDVFIVQSMSKPVNDRLMELLLIVDACKRDSARRIAAVLPYSAYASQDRRQNDARCPISAKLVADMLATVGVDRALTMDLYSEQVRDHPLLASCLV